MGHGDASGLNGPDGNARILSLQRNPYKRNTIPEIPSNESLKKIWAQCIFTPVAVMTSIALKHADERQYVIGNPVSRRDACSYRV